MHASIPDGFVPITRSSPFIDMLGPLYYRLSDDGLEIGLLAEKKHCNSRGIVHGGLLSTVADIALGYSAGGYPDGNRPMVTTSITIDFAGSAGIGDWIVFKTDVQKVGRMAAFANTYAHVGDRRIARASGIFSILDGKA
ncbi:PaaI family thioesterase [Hoeflea prorocentri]|uniref:PaaI family thioesterase n=1 Tax=Hoeflea prorocentri TaxID=1922333 RepID=A0A9X3UGQ2_9HYPH|nr:PaaI family thioesterase [Hoeflea prorocentri]MCY6380498.1 PaaI family thioesterase [Hoeflea prorocentri]MDA5398298.1 PaaI family thioesterase [Hoeflea prorocentri]